MAAASKDPAMPIKPATSPARGVAAVLLLAVAAVHVPLISEHLEEAPYIGWAFIVLSALCTVLAVAMLCSEQRCLWALSGATCLAAVIAFAASRTVGLPQLGDDVGNWSEPLGFPAVGTELLMVVLALVHLPRTAPRLARR
jgi:peptidoglycan/LPS O-acetylase OafA/YrhL